MTRKIKEFLFSHGLGKVWFFIKYVILVWFRAWILIKSLFRRQWFPVIMVEYDMAKLPEIKSKTIFPLQDITKNMKINPLFNGRESEDHFDQNVYTIPHGRVLGNYTIATQSNQIVWDLTRWHNREIGTNPYSYMILPNQVFKIDGSVAVMTSNDSHQNYNHRMTAALPKYKVFLESGIPIDKFLVDNEKSFHKEWLEALWLDTSKIIVANKSRNIECDQLICSNNPSIFGQVQPWVREFLCSLFLKNVEIKPAFRKIYVKRITNRRVANEQEFESLLADYGFETVILDKMSIKEQATLFNESKIIIWPHGAGFTNMLFCQPGTKIIELFHPFTIFGHYYTMAWTLGFTHHAIVGTRKKDSVTMAMDNDMIVDIEEVRKILNYEF